MKFKQHFLAAITLLGVSLTAADDEIRLEDYPENSVIVSELTSIDALKDMIRYDVLTKYSFAKDFIKEFEKNIAGSSKGKFDITKVDLTRPITYALNSYEFDLATINDGAEPSFALTMTVTIPFKKGYGDYLVKEFTDLIKEEKEIVAKIVDDKGIAFEVKPGGDDVYIYLIQHKENLILSFEGEIKGYDIYKKLKTPTEMLNSIFTGKRLKDSTVYKHAAQVRAKSSSKCVMSSYIDFSSYGDLIGKIAEMQPMTDPNFNKEDFQAMLKTITDYTDSRIFVCCDYTYDNISYEYYAHNANMPIEQFSSNNAKYLTAPANSMIMLLDVDYSSIKDFYKKYMEISSKLYMPTLSDDERAIYKTAEKVYEAIDFKASLVIYEDEKADAKPEEMPIAVIIKHHDKDFILNTTMKMFAKNNIKLSMSSDIPGCFCVEDKVHVILNDDSIFISNRLAMIKKMVATKGAGKELTFNNELLKKNLQNSFGKKNVFALDINAVVRLITPMFDITSEEAAMGKEIAEVFNSISYDFNSVAGNKNLLEAKFITQFNKGKNIFDTLYAILEREYLKQKAREEQQMEDDIEFEITPVKEK